MEASFQKIILPEEEIPISGMIKWKRPNRIISVYVLQRTVVPRLLQQK